MTVNILSLFQCSNKGVWSWNAGERCLHLSVEFLCALFGRAERPAVCSQFKAAEDVCGADQADAIRLIGWWEKATAVA
ncbi:hypothetical protein AO354_34040 [Pseudomonas syringae pv. syringae]|nr:hypothetical protein AO354_34040 [Pseudomonas syringae pv. syringae]